MPARIVGADRSVSLCQSSSPRGKIEKRCEKCLLACANGSPGNITKVPCAGIGPAITKYKAKVSWKWRG